MWKKGKDRISDIEELTKSLLKDTYKQIAPNRRARNAGKKRKRNDKNKPTGHAAKEQDLGQDGPKVVVSDLVEDQKEDQAQGKEEEEEGEEKVGKQQQSIIADEEAKQVVLDEEQKVLDEEHEPMKEEVENAEPTLASIISKETLKSNELDSDMLNIGDGFWGLPKNDDEKKKSTKKRKRRGPRKRKEGDDEAGTSSTIIAKGNEVVEGEQNEEDEEEEGKGGSSKFRPITSESSVRRRASLERASLEEMSVRQLVFEDEQKRVEKKVDDFYPKVKMTLEEYENQKSLVQHWDAEEERKRKEEEAVIERREKYRRRELETHSSVHIQKLCRGFLGRKRARKVKRVGGIGPYLEAINPTKHDWKQVHDPKTGDTWYYNTATGESQWELPAELGKLRKASDELQVNVGRNHTAFSFASSSEIETVGDFRPLSPSKSMTPYTTVSDGDFGGIPHVISDDTSLPPMSSQGTIRTSTPFTRPMTGFSIDTRSMLQSRGDLHTRGNIFTRGSMASETTSSVGFDHFPEPMGSNNTTITNGGGPDDFENFAKSAHMGEEAMGEEQEEKDDGCLDIDYSDVEEEGNEGEQAENEDEEEQEPHGHQHHHDDDLHSRTEAESDSGWGDSCETPRFFLPDGTTKVKLKETVHIALKQNKYDSVSTLLSTLAKEENDARRAAREEKRQKGKTSMSGNPSGLHMEDVVACANLNNPQQSLVSTVQIKNGQKRSKKQALKRKIGGGEGKLVKTTNNQDHEGQADGCPALYDIPHAGAKIDELKCGDEDEDDDNMSVADALAVATKHQNGDGAICFLCWSCGDDLVQRCDQHKKRSGGEDDDYKGSVLTCANWNIGALQRKYRSEEIQEVFAKVNSSLRWDVNRKRFITVVQAKHQVYRTVYELVDGYNRNHRSRIKCMRWFQSILDELRVGKIKSERASEKSALIKARDTIINNREIRKFKETVKLLEPKPPVTMDNVILAGQVNLEDGYKVLERKEVHKNDGTNDDDDDDINNKIEVRKIMKYIMAPIPVPKSLFRPYLSHDIPEPRTVRVPPPSFMFLPEADQIFSELERTKKPPKVDIFGDIIETYDQDSEHNEALEVYAKGTTVNRFMETKLPGSWLERLASHTAATGTEKAVKEIRDQIPQIVKLRTKHPPPTTNKFATFMRKEVQPSEKKHIHGLPHMMAMISQQVTTAVSAQYGKYTVATKTSIAPVRKRYDDFMNDEGFIDQSLTFKSYNPASDETLGPSYEPLASKLNNRRPPCIVACALTHEILAEERETAKNKFREELRTKLKQEIITHGEFTKQWENYLENVYRASFDDDSSYRHYHGTNIEAQTGESDDVGFRTTASMPGPVCEPEFDSNEFVPNSESAVPNTPGIRGAVTTKAGVDYPFCVPSTRELSLLDHFHALIFSDTFGNSSCCFTALGRQDPGEYLMKNNQNVSLGVLEMRLYRSFAYFQTPHIEEYKTAEGMPYWYNRKTGETYWEPPLVDLSAVDEDDSERPLIEDPLKPLTKHERKKYSSTLGAKRKPPSQLQMRQHMLRDYEEEQETKKLSEEQHYDEFAREKAKAEEKRKAVEKRYRERVGQVNILKGTAPLLSAEEEAIASEKEKEDREKRRKKAKKTKIKEEQKRKRQEQKQQQHHQQQQQQEEGNDDKSVIINDVHASPVSNSNNEDDEDDTDDTEHLITTIQNALQTVMKGNGADATGMVMSHDNLLKLGVGLGLGIGLGKQKQKTQQRNSTTIVERTSTDTSEVDQTKSTPALVLTSSENPLIVETPRHKGPFSNQKKLAPTPTPDEQATINAQLENDEEDNDDESEFGEDEARDSFATHNPAGEGKSWNTTGTAKAKSRGKLQKSQVGLPEGFVNSIYKPHTAKQHADYLPSVPNLNAARSVGVVKPRRILQDWSHVGFDPWSDGKDKYSTSFVPTLFVDEVTGESLDVGKFGDESGVQAQRAEISEKNKLFEELDQLFSWCRHGKYEEIEDFFNDPDCNFPIDTKDALGNTLLSVAAQNGNKRISKLCLRRGADINSQNLSGQTVLHYCMAYGFDGLAEYFMQKGADDSLVNADGLTCYEGLSLQDVENM